MGSPSTYAHTVPDGLCSRLGERCLTHRREIPAFSRRDGAHGLDTLSPRKPRSLRLLLTTNTDDSPIAAPAIRGFSRPSMASGIAATL